MDVTLSTLIEVHGEKTKKLSFRAPQAGDLRGIKLSLSGDGLSFETDAILDIGRAGESFDAVLAELVFAGGFSPRDVDRLSLDDVDFWHRHLRKYHERNAP